MQFAIDLIQKISAAGLLTLGAVVLAYFFFPDVVKKLSGVEKEEERLEEIM
jgi:flagellar motor component MotA